MKVGIIGCGHIAAVHLQAIRAYEGAEIVGIVDSFQDYARMFAAQHGIGNVYESAADLIEQGKPDVVHVLTPPATHCGVTVECLDRGCHVLVEKPMAINTTEADMMIEAANRNKLLLSVDHNCRFDPVIQLATDFLADGRLGELVCVEVDFGFDITRSPDLLREGAENHHWIYQLNGGPLQDQMPHPLSFIVGHMRAVKNIQVLSRCGGVLPTSWSDEIRVMIDGEPVHAEVYISFRVKPDAMVLVLRGTEGTAVADLRSMVVGVETNSALPRAISRGMSGFHRGVQFIKGGFGNIYKVATGKIDKTGGVSKVVSGFYEAIKNNTEPPVTMDEGKQVVELIQKIWPAPILEPSHREATLAAQTPSVSIRTKRRPTILVTGASGFIGSHLVKKLVSQSIPVRVLVRPSSGGLGFLNKMDVEIVNGDLSNPASVCKAVEGIETVYHVGAAMSGDWEVHRQSTVEGTQNIIDAVQKIDLKHLVYLSSMIVYDLLSAPNGTIIDESWPTEKKPQKMGSYSKAKLKAEQIMMEAHSRSGLPISVIRPGIVIGPPGRVFFPHMGYVLKDKMFIVLGSGLNVLPLVYIDNLINALELCAAQNNAFGKVYNIVDDGSITVMEYLNRFIEVTRLPSKIVKVPFALPYFASGMYEVAASLGVVKKGVTSIRQLKWKHKSLHFSNEAAKKDFDWRCEIPMDEALTRTFQWYAKSTR